MDVSACDIQARQPVVVESIFRRVLRKYPLPDRLSLGRSREGKAHNKPQAPQESRVQRALHVGRQDGEPAIRFHPLQQVVDLDIGIAVMAVFDFTAFAKQSVGFVEEENRAAVLRRVEHAPQILLGLSDVFAYHRRQIDAIQVQAQIVGDHFGGHGFSRSAVARKQSADT